MRRYAVVIAPLIAVALLTGGFVGTFLLPSAVEVGSAFAIWMGAAVLLGVALLAAWIVATRVPEPIDWKRIAVEQRLWESGRLGRQWLKVRQRLLRRRVR